MASNDWPWPALSWPVVIGALEQAEVPNPEFDFVLEGAELQFGSTGEAPFVEAGLKIRSRVKG